jgi:hypothetical protein
MDQQLFICLTDVLLFDDLLDLPKAKSQKPKAKAKRVGTLLLSLLSNAIEDRTLIRAFSSLPVLRQSAISFFNAAMTCVFFVRCTLIRTTAVLRSSLLS